MTSQVGATKNIISRQVFSNFFTIARFGPDTLFIFTLLSTLAAGLYYWGLWYLSLSVVLTLAVLLIVESTETISLSRAEDRQILGARCLVLQSASPERMGIVRLFSSNGNLDPELWSTDYSKVRLETGKIGVVTGMNSVILEITPAS